MIKTFVLQVDMDRFVEDGSLDENVDSFLSHDVADPRDTISRCMDVSKGIFACYSANALYFNYFLNLTVRNWNEFQKITLE